MFNVARISIFDVVCISVLILNISLRLAGLNIYFYDVFFLAIKWIQKRIHGNGRIFLPWDRLKVRQVAAFCTTPLLKFLGLSAFISLQTFKTRLSSSLWKELFRKVSDKRIAANLFLLRPKHFALIILSCYCHN